MTYTTVQKSTLILNITSKFVYNIVATKQLYSWLCQSVCLSICLLSLTFHVLPFKTIDLQSSLTKFGVTLLLNKGLDDIWYGWPWPTFYYSNLMWFSATTVNSYIILSIFVSRMVYSSRWIDQLLAQSCL